VNNRSFSFWKTSIAATLCVLILAFGATVSFAQEVDSSELQISAPATGTVVNPGQTIHVQVTPAVGVTLTQVFIIPDQPIMGSKPVNSPPFDIPVMIPNGIRLGTHAPCVGIGRTR
jgi:hypothetical protein